MKIKAVGISLILCFWTITTSYAAEVSLHELRSRFENWQQTFQNLSEVEQKKQLDQLKGYALYPYAQYQYLQTHFDTVSADEINQFVKSNGDFPLSSTLMQAYLEEQEKQKNWTTITAMSIDNSLASRCRYQYALLMQGKKQLAFKPVKDIWLSGRDLTSACDPLFNEWSNAGGKTPDLLLQRIGLVLNNNNIRLARHLTTQLPDNYKTVKKNLLALFDNPRKLADFSKNISPSPFSQKIAMLSFPRLVNVDAEGAKKLLPTLIKQQKLTKNNKNKLLRHLAINYFKDSATDKQKLWRDQYIAQNRDAPLIERRIRLELKENNLGNVANWLNLLPKGDSQKDEWRYWRAMILISENKQPDADRILSDLAQGRGFYAMYSAQKLALPYQFDFDYSVIESASPQTELVTLKNKYQNEPVIQRIDELHFWGMLPEANREWRNYLYSSSKDKSYAELARYAYSQNWGGHSVQATIAGKLWNNWVERFPIVYQEEFEKSLDEKAVSLSYVLAISRQESALDPTVQSPAGARGLMQLMPGTAKDSAKKTPEANYTSAEQLYDPVVNIQLGTYYLDYVYQMFDHNRILAAAAYNAGPNRVNRWLQETQGKLSADAFIESIPFTETRNYVKSVLVYDYIYQLILQDKPSGILKEAEVEYQY